MSQHSVYLRKELEDAIAKSVYSKEPLSKVIENALVFWLKNDNQFLFDRYQQVLYEVTALSEKLWPGQNQIVVKKLKRSDSLTQDTRLSRTEVDLLESATKEHQK